LQVRCEIGGSRDPVQVERRLDSGEVIIQLGREASATWSPTSWSLARKNRSPGRLRCLAPTAGQKVASRLPHVALPPPLVLLPGPTARRRTCTDRTHGTRPCVRHVDRSRGGCR
jgi:hypothetical protein